jgi:hypothetical protein
VKCDDEELFFDGFSEAAASSNMSLSGCASIEPNGLLHLTNKTLGSNLTGNAFYSTPIKLKNSTTGKAFSFSTAFAFAISIFNGYGIPKPIGQCFAFSFSPEKALPSQHLRLIKPKIIVNPLLQNYELVREKSFFYVIFNGEPYRVDMDLDNLKSNAHIIHSEYYYGALIQAWVEYYSSNNQLEIRLSPNSSKPILPNLSWHVDLSPILNETMYVGFSASSYHEYIAGWSFKVNGGEATSLDLETLPSPLPLLIYRDSFLKWKKYMRNKIVALLFVTAFTITVILIVVERSNDRLELERQRLELERKMFKDL